MLMGACGPYLIDANPNTPGYSGRRACIAARINDLGHIPEHETYEARLLTKNTSFVVQKHTNKTVLFAFSRLVVCVETTQVRGGDERERAHRAHGRAPSAERSTNWQEHPDGRAHRPRPQPRGSRRRRGGLPPIWAGVLARCAENLETRHEQAHGPRDDPDEDRLRLIPLPRF